MHVSMRKSALKGFARPGRALKNLWDSHRLDCGFLSRYAGHACKKDNKSYRKPWQCNPRLNQPDIFLKHEDSVDIIEINLPDIWE